MKTTPILKTIGLAAALFMSSFALISCDGDDNHSAPVKPLELKVGSSLSWNERDGNGNIETVKIVIEAYNVSTEKGTVRVERSDSSGSGVSTNNVGFSYFLAGGKDCFILERYELDEDDALARFNETIKDPDNRVTKALRAFGDPPTEKQLDELVNEVTKATELGFEMDYIVASAEDFKLFLVKNKKLEVGRGSRNGTYTVRGPEVEENADETEIETTGQEIFFKDEVIDVFIKL